MPFRCASSTWARTGRAGRAARQHLLEGAEHQGERRTELMADIGEERGLGPVELGQGLGAPALFLVGVGAGNGGRDLARHEAEERAVIRVEQPVGIEAHDQDAAASGVAAGGDGAGGLPARTGGSRFRSRRRGRPPPDLRRPTPCGFAPRTRSPGAGRVEGDPVAGAGRSWGQADLGGEFGHVLPGLDDVEQREGDVVRIARQGGRAALAGGPPGPACTVSAASSRNKASCRSPTTLWVSSLLAQMIPPGWPSSPGIGLYEKV